MFVDLGLQYLGSISEPAAHTTSTYPSIEFLKQTSFLVLAFSWVSSILPTLFALTGRNLYNFLLFPTFSFDLFSALSFIIAQSTTALSCVPHQSLPVHLSLTSTTTTTPRNTSGTWRKVVPGQAGIHAESTRQTPSRSRWPHLRHSIRSQGQKVLAMQFVTQIQLQGTRHYHRKRRDYCHQQRALPHRNPTAFA